MRLGVILGGEVGAGALVAHSRAALDRELRCDAELWLAVAADDATVLGAFQRRASGQTGRVFRRGSGGPDVHAAPGTVHVALALARPAALVPCDAKRIVNRYVRPLLRALTRAGHLAHYFGRDWVSVGHRPVAWVGFGHDATTQRTLFEAFVAVRHPFADAGRASFLGNEPVAMADTDPHELVQGIADAYGRGLEIDRLDLPDIAPASLVDPEPPWLAMREEAIGWIGAGPDAGGVFRVGGDLLASRDALARLEEGAPTSKDLGGLVDATLAAPGVALDGVRSLASVREVVAEALAARQG